MMSFVKQIDHVMLYLLFKSTRDWHVNCNVICIDWNWGFFFMYRRLSEFTNQP